MANATDVCRITLIINNSFKSTEEPERWIRTNRCAPASGSETIRRTVAIILSTASPELFRINYCTCGKNTITDMFQISIQINRICSFWAVLNYAVL